MLLSFLARLTSSHHCIHQFHHKRPTYCIYGVIFIVVSSSLCVTSQTLNERYHTLTESSCTCTCWGLSDIRSLHTHSLCTHMYLTLYTCASCRRDVMIYACRSLPTLSLHVVPHVQPHHVWHQGWLHLPHTERVHGRHAPGESTSHSCRLVSFYFCAP